jgi:ADP-heptose:LPS heptosyltransferase
MQAPFEKIRTWLQTSPGLRPVYLVLRSIKRFAKEVGAFCRSLPFVGFKLAPLILINRRRPVLFHRLLGGGDVICTFPAALKLKERHPGAVFIYNTLPDFRSLPIMGGVATMVTSLEISPLQKYWRFLFEAIYEFTWGDDGKNNYVWNNPPIGAYCEQHGVTPTRQHPRLAVSEAINERIDSLLAGLPLQAESPLIVFHTGPTWSIKEWPHGSWHALIRELLALGYKNLVRIGVGRNAFLGNVAVPEIPGVISLVDKLSLEETVGLISRAALFIGIDSGPLHMAAAVSTPAIGLWGPTNPDLLFAEGSNQFPVITDVECRGCHHRLPCVHWINGCPYDIRCMKSISVADVTAAVTTRLPLPAH